MFTLGAMQLAGGLGLFLLGMVILTDGLRALAGDALNRALVGFTKTPASGAATGAIVTAIVQSSSATTVAAIGFVSAGILTFSQALGILLGANVGTTVIVALVGFKLDLGLAALPLLLAGVLLRMFGRGKLRDTGWAVTGFALVFIGIGFMQGGMEPLEGTITPASFPDDTLWGRLKLVGIGMLITIVTQSSSAGVATALTALAAGAMSFHQAAAMVIGMDVGTTFTALLATLGGSQQTRRTGAAHVVFNVMTGIAALVILTPYTYCVDRAVEGGVGAHAQFALVGFHTAFNVLGVIAVLPFARRFAAMMERLVPDRGPLLTRRLEKELLKDTTSAVTALWSTVTDLTDETFNLLAGVLRGSKPMSRSVRTDRAAHAIAMARQYADEIETSTKNEASRARHIAAMHCLDHLDRLLDRSRQAERAETVLGDHELRDMSDALAAELEHSVKASEPEQFMELERNLKVVLDRIMADTQPYRARTIGAATAQLPLDRAMKQLDAVRWLLRVADHAWRIVHHLGDGLESRPMDGRSFSRRSTIS